MPPLFLGAFNSNRFVIEAILVYPASFLMRSCGLRRFIDMQRSISRFLLLFGSLRSSRRRRTKLISLAATKRIFGSAPLIASADSPCLIIILLMRALKAHHSYANSITLHLWNAPPRELFSPLRKSGLRKPRKSRPRPEKPLWEADLHCCCCCYAAICI